MSADDTAYETAMNSLGLLTATFHDGYQFGQTTMDYLGAVATDGRQLLRLTNGLTALARVLIMMRAEEIWGGTRGDIGATGSADSAALLGPGVGQVQCAIAPDLVLG